MIVEKAKIKSQIRKPVCEINDWALGDKSAAYINMIVMSERVLVARISWPD